MQIISRHTLHEMYKSVGVVCVCVWGGGGGGGGAGRGEKGNKRRTKFCRLKFLPNSLNSNP